MSQCDNMSQHGLACLQPAYLGWKGQTHCPLKALLPPPQAQREYYTGKTKAKETENKQLETNVLPSLSRSILMGIREVALKEPVV